MNVNTFPDSLKNHECSKILAEKFISLKILADYVNLQRILQEPLGLSESSKIGNFL